MLVFCNFLISSDKDCNFHLRDVICWIAKRETNRRTRKQKDEQRRRKEKMEETATLPAIRKRGKRRKNAKCDEKKEQEGQAEEPFPRRKQSSRALIDAWTTCSSSRAKRREKTEVKPIYAERKHIKSRTKRPKRVS